MDAVCLAAAETLGRTLKVSRAGYGAVDAAAQAVHVHHDWMAPGCDPLAPVLHLPDFGGFVDDLSRDESVCVADVRGDARTRDRAQALEALCARAFMNMPVVEHGQLVAMLFAHHEHVREWTAEDIAFMREVAARTRTAAERARTEARLRQVNESLEQAVAQRTHEPDGGRGQIPPVAEDGGHRPPDGRHRARLQQPAGRHERQPAGAGKAHRAAEVRQRRAVHRHGAGLGAPRRVLTQRLLAFSRRQTLDPKPVDVNRLIGSIEEMVRRTVGPGVEVEVVGAGGCG